MNTPNKWEAQPVSMDKFDKVPLTEARTKLGLLTEHVNRRREPLVLTRRTYGQAALFPIDDIWLERVKSLLDLPQTCSELDDVQLMHKIADSTNQWLNVQHSHTDEPCVEMPQLSKNER